ncbi:MAG TPA: class III extradiol ring-cleavage dioxygenase [Casimicrobiaceae bacterium]|nr:class III extradiol ring-cleavage dioxygenase [Casimicrobiaceae bacterium]
MKRLPTLFLSHGSPMHAVQPGVAGEAWKTLGATLDRPKALLMVSAHWETSVPMLTGSARPETIHDFGGFPPALYAIRYPAPGDPKLAARAVELLKREGIAAGIDGARGLDHGAWVPLLRMYPDADVPVVQLSVQSVLGPAHHLRVGRALAPLCSEGVLIVASGHTTHNLRDWMAGRRGGEAMTYAQGFAAWLAEKLRAHDTEALVDYREQAPDAARAHPTEEHFLPLFVALGAAGDDATPESIVRAFDGPALSLDSYLFRPAPVTVG